MGLLFVGLALLVVGGDGAFLIYTVLDNDILFSSYVNSFKL